LVESGRKVQDFYEVKKLLPWRLTIWKWLLQLIKFKMSATFFLLSSIPKDYLPKPVHVVAKQDYGIYNKSTKVT